MVAVHKPRNRLHTIQFRNAKRKHPHPPSGIPLRILLRKKIAHSPQRCAKIFRNYLMCAELQKRVFFVYRTRYTDLIMWYQCFCYEKKRMIIILIQIIYIIIIIYIICWRTPTIWEQVCVLVYGVRYTNTLYLYVYTYHSIYQQITHFPADCTLSAWVCKKSP